MKNLFVVLALALLVTGCATSPLEQREEELEKTLEENPKNAHAHYELGKIEFEEGENDEAIEHFEKAIQLNPANMDSYAHIAAIHNLNGDYDKVIELLQSPEVSNHPANRFALGIAYMGKSNLVGAKERLIKAMDDNHELEHVYHKALGDELPADVHLTLMEWAMADVLDRIMDNMLRQIRLDVQEDIREGALRDK